MRIGSKIYACSQFQSCHQLLRVVRAFQSCHDCVQPTQSCFFNPELLYSRAARKCGDRPEVPIRHKNVSTRNKQERKLLRVVEKYCAVKNCVQSAKSVQETATRKFLSQCNKIAHKNEKSAIIIIVSEGKKDFLLAPPMSRNMLFRLARKLEFGDNSRMKFCNELRNFLDKTEKLLYNICIIKN